MEGEWPGNDYSRESVLLGEEMAVFIWREAYWSPAIGEVRRGSEGREGKSSSEAAEVKNMFV